MDIKLYEIARKRRLKTDHANTVSTWIRRSLNAPSQGTILDFTGISEITPGFVRALFYPLILEYTGLYIQQEIKFKGISREVFAQIQENLTNTTASEKSSQRIDTDPDLYELSLLALVKLRELARDNPLKARIAFGISDTRTLERFATLTLHEMQVLSRSGVFTMSPRLDADMLDSNEILSGESLHALINQIGLSDNLK